MRRARADRREPWEIGCQRRPPRSRETVTSDGEAHVRHGARARRLARYAGRPGRADDEPHSLSGDSTRRPGGTEVLGNARCEHRDALATGEGIDGAAMHTP